MTNPFRRDKLSRTASETEERLDKTIANASDYDLTKQTVSKLHTMAEHMNYIPNKIYLKNVLPSKRQLAMDSKPLDYSRFAKEKF